MRVGIFPGSFKPPHKGHLEMVKRAIREDHLDKVVILISKYPRYLDDHIQNPQDYTKEELGIFRKKQFATKSEAIQDVKGLRSTAPYISAELSKRIWEIYLEHTKVIVDIRIAHFYSPMINANIYLKTALKKKKNDEKYDYIFYKSKKDEKNERFRFIQSKVDQKENRVHFKTVNMKYDISARNMRNAILKKKPLRMYVSKEFRNLLEEEIRNGIEE